MTNARGLDSPEGARVFFQHDRDEIEMVSLGGGQAALFSIANPVRRGLNQDSAALIPLGEDSCVLAVADGVGGEWGGEKASRSAIEAVLSQLTRAQREGVAVRTAILDAFELANEVVTAIGGGAATTLAVAEIDGGTLRSYHVGDSAVLSIGQRGRMKAQTVAHSPVGFALEAGVLNETEALFHEDRHIVSNVLGMADMRIEISSVQRLARFDTVVIASDGLLDNLRVSEIAEHVRVGALDRAARLLARASVGRMHGDSPSQPCKPDDLTFVVFRSSRGS
ncbi:protein phosphatase 2C domain-containing protein [Myxococcota bacterium]|nr:protein phosphatase 2C domain-containing protein [Myxococcota bacterium]